VVSGLERLGGRQVKIRELDVDGDLCVEEERYNERLRWGGVVRRRAGALSRPTDAIFSHGRRRSSRHKHDGMRTLATPHGLLLLYLETFVELGICRERRADLSVVEKKESFLQWHGCIAMNFSLLS
jgi:hypothetical protein